MQKLILAACLLWVCAVSAQRVKVCSCLEASPNAFAEFESVDAVCVGKVTEVKEVEVPYKSSGLFTVELEVKFRVENNLKGLDGSEVIVRTSTGCFSRGSEFEKGKKYLVYLHKRVLHSLSFGKTP